MILQSLVKLYETLADQGKVSRPGWCNAKVSYAVVLNHDGTIKDIVSVKQKVKRGKKTVEIPIIMQVPEMVTRANNIASSFLCENAKYLFGIDEKMSLRTFTKAALNCGQVRGPVQIGFAKSIDPVFSQDITVTRVAITTEKDAEKKNTEMGRKSIIG